MKKILSPVLAVLLVTSAVGARGAALSSDNRPYARVDAALDALALRINDVKKCIDSWESLKADLAAKKEAVAAENGGVIPSAYNDELWVKSDRASRVYSSCGALDKDQSLSDQARVMLHSVQPSNAPGIPKRRERYTALLALSNLNVKRLHNSGSSKRSH